MENRTNLWRTCTDNRFAKAVHPWMRPAPGFWQRTWYNRKRIHDIALPGNMVSCSLPGCMDASSPWVALKPRSRKAALYPPVMAASMQKRCSQNACVSGAMRTEKIYHQPAPVRSRGIHIKRNTIYGFEAGLKHTSNPNMADGARISNGL